MSAKIIPFPVRIRGESAVTAAATINPHRSGMAPASAWDRLLGAAGVPESEVQPTQPTNEE